LIEVLLLSGRINNHMFLSLFISIHMSFMNRKELSYKIQYSARRLIGSRLIESVG